MADALLWMVIAPAVVLGVLVWSSVVAELRDEFRSYRSVPTRQRARTRSAARAIRSRVGDRSPEFARSHGDSPGRHRSSDRTAERAIPPAGTWRVSVPAGGPATRHGRPICG